MIIIELPDPPDELEDSVARTHPHLDIQLPPVYKRWFCEIWQSLRDSDAVLHDSTPVKSKPDVIKWLLEQYGLSKSSSSGDS